jgi:hypothetical protein
MGERQRAAAKARWADPVAAEKLRGELYGPASRAQLGEAMKARWADPEMREKMLAQLRATNADPVVRQKKASAIRERWAMREKMMAAMRGKPKRRRNRDTADG